jgi:hypothetical protein
VNTNVYNSPMRILFAWEMGKNFGHATQIAEIARILLKRKADIYIALKNPAAGMPFMKEFEGRILQAPYHPPQMPKGWKSLTYAEGLVPCGYMNADQLTPVIAAWRGLYNLVKPDILVTQAAPTALLAARDTDIKRMTFGRGFDVPPLSDPMPVFRYWQQHDTEVIRKREDRLVKTINESLKRLRAKPLKNFAQAIETDKEFLCTFKELDHYKERNDSKYYGALFSTNTGERIEWRMKALRRIFVYMDPSRPPFAVCMEALRKLPESFDVIAACPGLPATAIKKLEKSSLRIVGGPVMLENLLEDCSLAITNGSSGLCHGLALAGIPMLMLPLHVEQIMSARAVGRSGMGLALLGQLTPAHIATKIEQILADDKFTDNAKDVARRYKKYTSANVAKTLADEIAA